MAQQLGSNRYAALLSDDDDSDTMQNAEESSAAGPVQKRVAKKKKKRKKIIEDEETAAAIDEKLTPTKGHKRRRTAIAEATLVEPAEQLASSAFAASGETSAEAAVAPQLGSNRYAALLSDDSDGGDAQDAEGTPAAISANERTAKKTNKRAKNIANKEMIQGIDEQPTPRKGQKMGRRTAVAEAPLVEPAQQFASAASTASVETSAVNVMAPLRSNRYAALLLDDDDDDDDDDDEDAQHVEQLSAARPKNNQTARTEKGCAKKAVKKDTLAEADEQVPLTKGQKRKRPTATEVTPAEPVQRLASSASSARQEAPLPAGTKRTLPGGVTIKVIRAAPEGSAVARHGCEVKLLFEGSLPNKKGLRFDAGEIDFLLGDGTMLKGFAMGVVGMHVGERRLIHIPWRLGYGKKGKPPKIPAMSDLDFDASLVFCGVDWEHRISDKRSGKKSGKKSDMSNKRREAGKRIGKKTKAT